MNSVLLIRILLCVIVFIIIVLLFRLHKAISSERRIARYSLKIDTQDDESYFDRLWDRYKKLVNRCKKNKRLVKYSMSYQKYVSPGEELGAIQFIVNKLIIAFLFVIFIIIYNAIQGKMISIFVFIFNFILGYYIYDIYLIISHNIRNKRIKNDMLRAVIVMNNAFKAGKSTLQAVSIASRDLPKPIAREFEKISQDMSYGLSVDIAFSRFAKRVKLEEASYIASVLTILNKTGGNIINVFSSIEKTLFDKKKLEEDLKNSTGAAKFMVIFLIIIPVLLVFLISNRFIGNPNYFDPLFASPLGYFVLFIILIMFIAYIYFLLKLLKVKV